jgi:peptidoglycan/xylan/chitin deacetylase (PgdA/CDA1 family)
MKHTKSFSVTILALLLMSGFAAVLVAPGSPVGEASAYEGDGRGYVCLTFDDALTSQYQYAFPLLQAAGMNATIYPSSGLVGDNGYITAEQLLEMQSAGWEVGSQGVNHTDLTSISLAAATSEIVNSKSELEAMGLVINSFVYPNSAHNATLRNIADDHYALQRPNVYNVPHYVKHVTSSVDEIGSLSPTSLEMFQASVDGAIATDSAVVLHWHGLYSNGTFTDKPYSLNDVISYIAAKTTSDGLRTITISDLIGMGADDVVEWSASSAGVASNGANWVGGVAPSAGKHLIFPAGSANCTLDQAIDYGDIQTSIDYTGYITQGSNDVSFDLISLYGGKITGNTAKLLRCDNGLVIAQSGIITQKTINLVMSGDDKPLCSYPTPRMNTIRFSGDTTLIGSIVTLGHVIDVNVTVELMSDAVYNDWYAAGTSYTYVNQGSIIGGTLNLELGKESRSITLGTIDGATILTLPTDANLDRSLTLAADAWIGDKLDINSKHGTYALTVDCNGYDLGSDKVMTVGARGILLGGEGKISTPSFDSSSGAWTPETSTVELTGTGAVKLGSGQSFYNLNISSGASVTMQSDITVTHAFSLLGVINKNGYTLTLPAGWSNEIISTPSETVAEDAAYSYTPQSNWAGTFTVTTDADWLTWDGTRLSGTPHFGDVGTFNVSIEFTNGVGTVYQNYTITVRAASVTGLWLVVPIVVAVILIMIPLGVVITSFKKKKEGEKPEHFLRNILLSIISVIIGLALMAGVNGIIG